jgi:hypothetical protein
MAKDGWIERAEDELEFFDENPEVEIDNIVAIRDLLEQNARILDKYTRRRVRRLIEDFDAEEEVDTDVAVEMADLLRRTVFEAKRMRVGLYREWHR